jgi:RNA polymerase sigma-70 factor, ECF subfamily
MKFSSPSTQSTQPTATAPKAMSEFERLLALAEADLRAYIGSLVRDPISRDDLYQDTCLTLWKTFEKYLPSLSFGAWARGIATNKILQARKREARQGVVLSVGATLAVQEAWDAAEAAEPASWEHLNDCLATLSEKSALLVSLFYGQNLRAVEIARRMNVPANTVHQSLSRIRNRLMDCMKSRLQTITQRF